MNSEQFHAALEAAIKAALQKWSSTDNPLEWDGLPSTIAGLMENAVVQAFASDRLVGYNLEVEPGKFSDGGALTPNDDAIIHIALNPITDSDDWVSHDFNLADEVLKNAEETDQGWSVSNAIGQLERTIARLKQQADERGWALES